MPFALSMLSMLSISHPAPLQRYSLFCRIVTPHCVPGARSWRPLPLFNVRRDDHHSFFRGTGPKPERGTWLWFSSITTVRAPAPCFPTDASRSMYRLRTLRTWAPQRTTLSGKPRLLTKSWPRRNSKGCVVSKRSTHNNVHLISQVCILGWRSRPFYSSSTTVLLSTCRVLLCYPRTLIGPLQRKHTYLGLILANRGTRATCCATIFSIFTMAY